MLFKKIIIFHKVASSVATYGNGSQSCPLIRILWGVFGKYWGPGPWSVWEGAQAFLFFEVLAVYNEWPGRRNTGHILWEDCQSQAALSSYAIPALKGCRILRILLKLSETFFLINCKKGIPPTLLCHSEAHSNNTCQVSVIDLGPPAAWNKWH